MCGRTLDHVLVPSVNAGEDTPWTLLARFTFADVAPQIIQGETKLGSPLTPCPVHCYFLRRDRALGDVSRVQIEKLLRREPRGLAPGNWILMDQQVSCQVVLYGTCKKWPAPLPFPLRGGSVSFPF